MEIPYLDERRMAVEGQQPRRTSYLYKLPPYIRDVDLAREVIVVSNPEPAPLDLSGHYLVDKGEHHRFEFEDGYVLPGGADVHVYCAPGKHAVEEEERPGELQILLWTNKDGKPRRREVLNPEADKITLMDANGVEIAALEVTAGRHGKDADDDADDDGGSATKRLYLYRLELLQTAYVGNVVTTLQGMRLVLAVLAFILLLVNDLPKFVLLEVLVLFLDVLARVTDPLRLPRSKQRILALVADRVEVTGLLVALMGGVLEPSGLHYQANIARRVRLALGLLLIELLASWFEVLVDNLTRVAATDAAAPFWKQQQAEEAAAIQWGPYRKWVKQHLRRCPWLVMLVTAGNHLYLLLAVAALAHWKEGDEYGLVTYSITTASKYLAYLPLPAALTVTWNFLLLPVGLAALYRSLLVWAELMDLLEGKL